MTVETSISPIWTPPENTTRHARTAIPTNIVFFAEPTLNIGHVVSADSTLSDPPPPTYLGWIVAVPAIFFSAIALTISFLIKDMVGSFPFVAIIGIALTAAIALTATLLWRVSNTAFYTCSFVGQSGVAQGQIQKFKPQQPKVETLCFEDAIALYTSQTHQFLNGQYVETLYKYEWTRKDNPSYVISGTYRNKEGRPPEGDPFYFASAAENAWVQHLLPIVQEDFKTLGHVDFPMSGNLQMVRLEKGTLEFILKSGETQKTLVEDMKDTSLSSGTFYFNHKDTRWWSGKGKYQFSYKDIPNAQLFLLCLQNISGVRLGPLSSNKKQKT